MILLSGLSRRPSTKNLLDEFVTIFKQFQTCGSFSGSNIFKQQKKNEFCLRKNNIFVEF